LNIKNASRIFIYVATADNVLTKIIYKYQFTLLTL